MQFLEDSKAAKGIRGVQLDEMITTVPRWNKFMAEIPWITRHSSVEHLASKNGYMKAPVCGIFLVVSP